MKPTYLILLTFSITTPFIPNKLLVCIVISSNFVLFSFNFYLFIFNHLFIYLIFIYIPYLFQFPHNIPHTLCTHLCKAISHFSITFSILLMYIMNNKHPRTMWDTKYLLHTQYHLSLLFIRLLRRCELNHFNSLSLTP